MEERKEWKYETAAEKNARKRFDAFYEALNRSEPARAAHTSQDISTAHPEHYLGIAADIIEEREHISPRPLTVCNYYTDCNSVFTVIVLEYDVREACRMNMFHGVLTN